jgi:raffinose/stachyose/melibiose transport system substrate-binding protein
MGIRKAGKISVAALVSAAVLVLVLTGCKKKDASEEGGKITLRVLSYFDITSTNSADEIAQIWDAFAQANPDIIIVREDLFNEPFHNRVEAYAAAGQLPDVVYAWPSGRSTTLHSQRFLKDLGPLIARDGLASLYTPAALDPAAQGAGYLAILPQAITSSHVFYINNEVLRDAGLSPAKTYAELKEQVPVLRAKGYDTIVMCNQESWVMQSCLFSLIAGRFCGEGWEQRILSGQAKFTDRDFVAALNFVKALYDDGVLTKATLTTDYDSVLDQFAANKAAYLIDGDWRVGAFITDQSTGQAVISPARQQNIQITVFPDIAGAQLNRSTSVTLGTGWGINANIPAGSPREEAAWRLVKWLSGREIQTWRLEAGGIATPTRTDIDVNRLSLEPMQKAIGNIREEYDVGTAVIDNAFHSDVYTPINDGLREIGLGTQTPEQVARGVQRAFNAWKAAR